MPSWLPARAQVDAAMDSCWHETKCMAGQPCPPCIVDPTKLKYCNSDDGGKYSGSEERTFSRTCKSRVLYRYRYHEYRRYPGPRESVHIKLLVSPVSFSYNSESFLTVRLAVSEIKPVQSLTDGQTDRRAD